MSAASPPREETFPKLSEEQRGRIAAFARERRFADGEMLWEQGDCDRPLFVVLEGKITVLSDTDHLVTAHEPGQFSGDVDLLSGRPVVVKGRATGETRVLELPAERLRALVQTDPELSEIFLRAFILRRIALQARVRAASSSSARVTRPARSSSRSSSRATDSPTRTSTWTATPTCRRLSTASASAWTTCPSSSAGARAS